MRNMFPMPVATCTLRHVTTPTAPTVVPVFTNLASLALLPTIVGVVQVVSFVQTRNVLVQPVVNRSETLVKPVSLFTFSLIIPNKTISSFSSNLQKD